MNQSYIGEIINCIENLKQHLLIQKGLGVKEFMKQKKLNKNELLSQLYKRYLNCKKCDLGNYRIKFVFGDGDPNSKLVFIGEAPGYDEDRQGLPFVGRAGMLLNELIEKILKLKRNQVYITNVVKCHPMIDPTKPDLRGNDRPPSKTEIEACYPILQEQLKIISPKIICTLGNCATSVLLKTDSKITNIHGKIFEFNNVKLLPTFHPSAILRTPSLENIMINDFKKLRKIVSESS